jgi:hypothetical protein
VPARGAAEAQRIGSAEIIGRRLASKSQRRPNGDYYCGQSTARFHNVLPLLSPVSLPGTGIFAALRQPCPNFGQLALRIPAEPSQPFSSKLAESPVAGVTVLGRGFGGGRIHLDDSPRESSRETTMGAAAVALG